MGLSYRRFLLFDSLGCLLWSGVYVGIGMIFSREVTKLLDWMSVVTGRSIAVLAGLLAVYIGWKVAHRWRLRRLHRLVRISPDEIVALLERDPDLLILDARSSLARAEDPRTLPRSIVLDDRIPAQVLPHDARDKTVVTFCTCPNEASAALMAEQLIKAVTGACGY
jgi:rhodanese-related sulfurtransferase